MATKHSGHGIIRLLSHRVTSIPRMTILSIVLLICSLLNMIALKNENLRYVDSQLKPYADNFMVDALARGKNLDASDMSIIFGLEDVSDMDVVGMCRSRGFEHRIEIRKYVWDMLTTEEKEMLVYHEMAHCLLKRNHCNKKIRNVPVSIMSSMMIDYSVYKFNRDKYVDELFDKNAKCK